MILKELLILACLAIVPGCLGVDCRTSYCLTQLYNSRVIRAEYYTRPLGSSGSSSSGWWWSSGKRRKRHDYHLHHAGIVVTISGNVLGKRRWLIHKGKDYGDSSDTVITDADYMGSGWTRTGTKYISCSLTVNRFLQAARIRDDYRLIGPNCQTAANGMWDLANC